MLQTLGKGRMMVQACCLCCFAILFGGMGVLTLKDALLTKYIKGTGKIIKEHCTKKASTSRNNVGTEYSCHFTVEINDCIEGSGSGSGACIFEDKEEIMSRGSEHVGTKVDFDYPKDDESDKEIGDRKQEGLIEGGGFTLFGVLLIAGAVCLWRMRNNKLAQTVAGAKTVFDGVESITN